MKNTSECHRKYTLNQNVFKNTTNPETLYWAGFLMADGSIAKYQWSYYTRIGLGIKDIEHVHKFQRFCGTNKPVKVREVQSYGKKIKYASLEIGSKEIYHDLLKFGLTPNKSFTAKAKRICVNSKDFWRGVIDGDGCFYVRKDGCLYIHLVRSQYICKQFAQFIFKHTKYKVNVKPTKNIFRTVVGGIHAKTIISLLYKDANTYLDRKMLMADDIIKSDKIRWITGENL